ncbi:MAG: DUF4292 domain-containing protein [Bacteroidia bacterium]|nr:DUF4292 domain-containing protein [Bacteroidia bacterium]MCZ2276752.1 DUF4292 domain-containing protein [Bacteroidia bacterium]
MNKIGRVEPLFHCLLSLSCLFIITSCRTAKKAEKPIVIHENKKLAELSAEELLLLIQQHNFNADWLSAKAEVESTIDEKKKSFDITLRMRKDSIIWISISPLLGLEAARIMITRDSVKFLNRLNKEYQVTNYDFLNNLLRMNIDFDIIQGILTGNIFAYKKNKFNSVYNDEDRYYIISTLSRHKLKRSMEEKDLNKPIVQDMWISDENYRIIKLSIEDDKIKKALITQYADFRSTNTGFFPYHSNTVISADSKLLFNIVYKRLLVNEPQQFPFTIPSSYTKIR